jgi:hypothetical protein
MLGSSGIECDAMDGADGPDCSHASCMIKSPQIQLGDICNC